MNLENIMASRKFIKIIMHLELLCH